MTKEKIFTRTIWMLSFVSLFNDIGSEMLIPVMPIYLQSIGFSALWIGILEGIAEAVVGVSKGYFGKLSDEKGQRLPFIQLGYLLSNITKPLMAVFTAPLWVLLIRTGDKLGKGIRTGARDAMLSDECSKENKGKVFGLHRSMDTVGAAIGPALALLFLYFYPGNYKSLFLFAFIPGMVAVAFTLFIKEKRKELPVSEFKANNKKGFFSYFSYWKTSSTAFKKLMTGLLLFTLFNSSDVFLLLMAKHIGIDDLHIIGVYIFYNLVYALFAYPIGSLADKIGMRATFIMGLILFAGVYGGMAFVKTEIMLYVLFFFYGIYAAATDGISKAWIAKITPGSETATAIGFYASGNSILTMIASSMAGLIWVAFNPTVTFLVAATGVLLVVIYFLFQKKDE
ncbi:MAG TPA: MFS transporter [Bacteroidia bacterium]|jgi:MFS family permease